MMHQSDPPQVAPPSWSEAAGAIAGLPSWMAPKPEDEEEDASQPVPSMPPSQRPVVVSELVCEPTAVPARDYEGEIAELERQLQAMAQTAHAFRRQVLEASERQLVDLALAVAERLVGRELSVDPSLVATWAREGLKALADSDELVIAVSSDLAAAFEQRSWGDATVEIDPALPPASCDIRGALGHVDAGLRARLDAMAEALGSSEDQDAA